MKLLALSNLTQLDTPTGVTCTLTDSRGVKVFWHPIDDISLSHYEVQRSVDNSTYSLVDKVMVPRTAYLDRNIVTGTYWYKIYGVDYNKFSSCGSTATGITLGVAAPFTNQTQVATNVIIEYDFQSFFARNSTNINIHRLGGGAITISYAGPNGTYLSSEKVDDIRTLEKSDRRFNMAIGKVKITGSGADTSFILEAV